MVCYRIKRPFPAEKRHGVRLFTAEVCYQIVSILRIFYKGELLLLHKKSRLQRLQAALSGVQPRLMGRLLVVHKAAQLV
jgi:hypothetical protein